MQGDKILVLGGDGFCGWPAALHLSDAGYDVTIVDNFSRRRIDNELQVNSLTPIVTMGQRIKTWRRMAPEKRLSFKRLDVARNYPGLVDVLRKVQPAAVVHFAQQRAAPYSMRSPKTKQYTVNTNVMATHNLLCALVELGMDTHVVHLGTMGVYGYGTGGITIPEGYLEAQLVDVMTQEKVETEIYYPPDPGSVYHMTKVIDTMMFYFYNKNDQLRITDLHQGIIWGAGTRHTGMHPDLINRLDYDGDYGTVLNRFLIQGVQGHPLTVYGTGGQTRAFIHIQNMAECIQLAIESPPEKGTRVRVWNQTTEQLTLMGLAKLVSEITGAAIRLYSNPRLEAESNKLSACMDNIHGMGLEPIKVHKDTLGEIIELIGRYPNRGITDKVYTTSMWNKDRVVDKKGTRYA
ncbi:hypothetical protein LCGC14_1231170 [marine sediment metagenome]|uniref:NAD-dependent epimerase/dehydratase domain-containing protein n=1 Tax=marine sediment metagenome TaxID=412755 RepID=A0A0F9L8H2_9ZZZZ